MSNALPTELLIEVIYTKPKLFVDQSNNKNILEGNLYAMRFKKILEASLERRSLVEFGNFW